MDALVKQAYDLHDIESLATGLQCPEESLTTQSSVEESDINTIVRRFGLTGELPKDLQPPVYADFDGVYDFHEAMNMIRYADESFMRMPAEVRARFHNSTEEFVDFVNNPANVAEMVKLGLAVAVEAEQPAVPAAPVVTS